MSIVELSRAEIERRARHASQRATRQASPWIERLGRFGHAAIGLVYATIGALAAEAALGRGGATTDSHGALGWIVQAPHGRALLGALAVGLGGYALWRLIQAVRDTESAGSDLRGILTRLVYAGIGATYAVLALSALRLVGGVEGRGGDAVAQDWTARLLAQPFGQWLVAAAGLGVVGVGLFQFYLAFGGKICDRLQLSEMSQEQARFVVCAGQVGYSARGVALAIIGGFLVIAGLRAQPAEARGLGGALETLGQQPLGPWLLGAVAVGLLAYGVFMVVQARYRRLIVR